jgi:hypothetical protein
VPTVGRVCRCRRTPPLIHSTDPVAVLPRSLTGTPMHLPARADFGIFGAWDCALLSWWLFVAGGLCRTLARASRRHRLTDSSFRVACAVGTALMVMQLPGW